MDASVSVKNTLQKVSSNTRGNISYELMCPIIGQYLGEIIIGSIAGWIGILALLYAGEHYYMQENTLCTKIIILLILSFFSFSNLTLFLLIGMTEFSL